MSDTRLSEAAREMGRKGGSRKTLKKTLAARETLAKAREALKRKQEEALRRKRDEEENGFQVHGC